MPFYSAGGSSIWLIGKNAFICSISTAANREVYLANDFMSKRHARRFNQNRLGLVPRLSGDSSEEIY